jgi:uncharacterized protein YlxW (UPF0749 family)
MEKALKVDIAKLKELKQINKRKQKLRKELAKLDKEIDEKTYKESEYLKNKPG